MKHATWHIRITGLVQGVGFRPFIYNRAIFHALKGWVRNGLDGVHIEVSGSESALNSFYEEIPSRAPALSQITDITVKTIELVDYKSFTIESGAVESAPKLYLTPDFATCDSCYSELGNPSNKRYQYPFITCTKCGPRYSIVRRLPYEREYTTMDDFLMCKNCNLEYRNNGDRRFYAQTNSCAKCGIGLTLYDADKNEVAYDDLQIIQFVVDQWQAGKIVAIKGIGGYLLTCAANQPETIRELRSRKHRPDKPLALMYPNLDALASFHLSESQVDTYRSPAAPIVLIDKRDNLIAPGISDGLSKVGVMLPYAPLFRMLLDRYENPIVATSGNISNDPIVFQDALAVAELTKLADFVLVHNREIVVPQDDSVVAFSERFNQKVIIRRSRGLAPSYYSSKLQFDDKHLLAMGADLKSTVAIHHHGNVYISQYIGDLGSHQTQQNYLHTTTHLSHLLDLKPELILVDGHPHYVSTAQGMQQSEDCNTPILFVQHHVAHFSALLGEHALIETDENVLGVIWDGTGWGDDSSIWGSEFFLYKNYTFERCAHLGRFIHLAQDKMAKEPRIAALSICQKLPDFSFLKKKFTAVEWNVYAKLLKKEDMLQTTSMGRLFDAVASLLDLCDIQTYEGQAASLLQVAAEDHFISGHYRFDASYFPTQTQEDYSLNLLINALIRDLDAGLEKGAIAAKFHNTLVDWIANIAHREKVTKIGFSGGVFQNTLLIDLIIAKLDSQFELLFHQDFSPNDENISFGQIIYATIAANRADD